MTALKAEVTELVDLCGTLEMWVQLNIPKIQVYSFIHAACHVIIS
jgi:hypothetical protein